MPRVKRGVIRRARHKKVLALTKGHRASRHLLFRRAKESMTHALKYATRHRRERKGDMRRLWILRIGAAARQEGLSYSQLMSGLKKAGVAVNRKMLADLAVREPGDFGGLVKIAKTITVADPSTSS